MDLVKKYTELTPASNTGTKLSELANISGFLLRFISKEASFTVARDNKILTLVTKCMDAKNYKIADIFPTKESLGYKLLENNIGYIFPAKLVETDLDSIKLKFKDTKGLVIDMRCYPKVFMPYSYGAWLKCKRTPFVKLSMSIINSPGYFEFTDGIENGMESDNCYKGKVVIIANEETVSQAEYTTMALATAPNAVVIGSTTAGADGDVSEINLPGGIKTRFSGIGVFYPDKTITQRKGVKIDKIVLPTIKGVREGKDELLDAAIKMIEYPKIH